MKTKDQFRYINGQIEADQENLKMNSEQNNGKSMEQEQAGGRWDKEQHTQFLKALMTFGKNWKAIEQAVSSRTTSQVRSHAQKFFLKMSKLEKQRKRNKRKERYEASKIQEQFTESLLAEQITENTPKEILVFLNKQSLISPSKDLKQENLNENSFKRSSKTVNKQNEYLMELQAGQSYEEDSFLVTLIKHNMESFKNGQFFSSLIDVPEHIAKELKEEDETANRRKVSFSLYEEDEDSQKLNEVRKKINN